MNAGGTPHGQGSAAVHGEDRPEGRARGDRGEARQPGSGSGDQGREEEGVQVIAALYARKSTEDERTAEDGKSTDRQLALARKFAESKGWAVGETFVDDGISGANFERAGLVALLAGAKAKRFQVVVMMSLDRLGRG